MKLLSHPPLHRSPVSRHWRDHVRELLHRARLARTVTTHNPAAGHSFDDSRHPVWAIASAITLFFLLVSVLGLFVLLVDAIWTRA